VCYGIVCLSYITPSLLKTFLVSSPLPFSFPLVLFLPFLSPLFPSYFIPPLSFLYRCLDFTVFFSFFLLSESPQDHQEDNAAIEYLHIALETAVDESLRTKIQALIADVEVRICSSYVRWDLSTSVYHIIYSRSSDFPWCGLILLPLHHSLLSHKIIFTAISFCFHLTITFVLISLSHSPS
jgi:hypothetical protein